MKMEARAFATLKLQASTGNDSGDTSAQTELDFANVFVSPGKREMKAVLSAILTSTDSGFFDYKLQESNTTVDSDFSDISGGAFTQVGSTGSVPVELHFFTNKRYVRGHQTVVGGTSWAVTALVFAVKRDA
jgi:hypothetical protein